jgi:hypothetical protein
MGKSEGSVTFVLEALSHALPSKEDYNIYSLLPLHFMELANLCEGLGSKEKYSNSVFIDIATI